MSADVLAGPGQVTTGPRARCGCGEHDTVVKVEGEAWSWICWLTAGKNNKINFIHDIKAPQYAPRVQRKGEMLDPTWCPRLADIQDLVHHASFGWSRPFDGPTVVLDRSGAHVSSAASVEVAWGALVEQGPTVWEGTVGNYKVPYFDWNEEGTPHPLGGGAAHARRTGWLWVPHTRVKLLADLAVAGRIPELEPMEAWTCHTKVRLDRWAKHIAATRNATIDRYGRESEQYEDVKRAFSKAIAMMVGKKEAGGHRVWDGGVHRTDWAFAIKDLSACTMWRWCDDLGAVARDAGRPELSPVGIQYADELVIPQDGLELFVSTNRRPMPGSERTRSPLKLDPAGKTLGTFKVKSVNE